MRRLTLKTKFILLALSVFILAAILSGAMALELKKMLANEKNRAEYAQSFDTGAKKLLQANVEFKIQVQEWKNILLRGNTPTDFDEYRAQFDQQAMTVQQLLKETKQLLAHTKEAVADINQLQQDHAGLTAQYRSALSTFNVLDPQVSMTIDTKVHSIDRAFTLALEQKARDVSIRSMLQLKRDSDDTHAEMQQVRQNQLMRATLAISILAIILWFFYRNITQQIGGDPHQTNQLAQRVVAGDLTVRIDNPADNSILAQVQQMRDWLAQSVVDLRSTCKHLSLIAQQLQQIANSVIQSTEQQTKAIEMNSTTLEQIAATAEQNASHASKLERLIVLTPETKHLTQEIIYASKEQMQSIQLTSHHLISVTRAGDKNRAVAKEICEVATHVAQEISKIHAVFETFITEQQGKQR
jgi:hypothetical protein